MAKTRRFFIVTTDHSGNPLAYRLQDEGFSVVVLMVRPELADGKLKKAADDKETERFKKRTKYLEQNGKGLIKRLWIDEVWPSLIKLDRGTTYFIFDQIYGWQYGEALRKMGFKVLGGTRVGYLLETERDPTLKLFKKLGMDVPLMKKFGNGSSEAGIQFLQQAGDDFMFVFKSDNPKVVTEVAQDSNEELIQKIQAEKSEIDKGGFILQQKVEGVEAAIESWYCNGEPVLCNIDIEAKRKYNETSEVQTGCAGDLLWVLPVDHPLCRRANGPFDDFAAEKIGTGLLDLSFIYNHQDDKLWALECCGNRFPYNAFYTMLSLLNIPVGEFLSDLLDGKYKRDIGQELFTQEFGTSLRLFNEGEAADQPVQVAADARPYAWLWDVHKAGGQLLTTGDESLGIITAVGANPEGSFAELRKTYFKVRMPTKWSRDDLDEEDELGLPLARYHALKRYKMI